MNTLAPLLIALAVSAPLVALMVWLHIKVHRAPCPEATRLKVLRVLMWCYSGLVFAGVVAEFFSNGTGTSILMPSCVLLSVFSTLIFQIQQCKRRLKKEGQP